MSEDAAVRSKDTILDAAEGLLFNKGYAGLTMRELAEACGLAKATIYHHFKDKDDVCLQVMMRDLSAVRQRMSAVAALPEEPEARLRLLMETYFELVTENRHVILNALRETGMPHAEMRGLIMEHSAKLLQPFAQVIEDGVQKGEFRPIEVRRAVLSLVGMMNGFASYYLFIEDRAIEQDVVDHILDLYLHGLVFRDRSEGTERDADGHEGHVHVKS